MPEGAPMRNLDLLLSSVRDRDKFLVNNKVNGNLGQRQRSERYIPTGFKDIDIELGGGLPYGISVAGARPEDGLTDFGLNIAINASKKNHKVAFVSPDLPERLVIKRALMSEAGLNPKFMKQYGVSDCEFQRFSKALARWEDANLQFWCEQKLDAEDFRKVCKGLVEDKGVDFVVLDRLQSLLPKGSANGTSYYSIGQEIAAVLDEIVTEEGLGLLVLCEAKKKGAEPISTNHLRDCGALEYGARPIIMIEKRRIKNYSGHDLNVHDLHVSNNLEGQLNFKLALSYLDYIGKFENHIE